MQCLSKKEDRKCKTLSVLFLSVRVHCSVSGTIPSLIFILPICWLCPLDSSPLKITRQKRSSCIYQPLLEEEKNTFTLIHFLSTNIFKSFSFNKSAFVFSHGSSYYEIISNTALFFNTGSCYRVVKRLCRVLRSAFRFFGLIAQAKQKSTFYKINKSNADIKTF